MSNIQQLLTEYLDIWTSADTAKKIGRGRSSSNADKVYGIKKLRELIIELAVRGKLLPQDPSDEPASALLKCIQKEKAKLVAEGKIKKEKPLPPICNEEKPFELPVQWEWVRLGSIGVSSTGRTPSTQNASLYNGLIPFVGPGQITTSGEFLLAEKWLSEAGRNTTTIASPGDILMVCIGGSIGKSAIARKEMAFNQQINCIQPLLIDSDFIHISMKASNFQLKIIECASGSATPIINKSKWEELLISIPPTVEQCRIITKVNELMALCDQLEAQDNNISEAHEKLVNHFLGTLMQPQRAEEFNENWQRIATHFDILFTTESSIDALKQTLLQLAVMGKLVSQDPNDEPASELLKRIQKEKTKLIAEGKIKKEKSLAPINDNEKPFELPVGWEWSSFPGVGELARGKSKHRPRNDPKLYKDGSFPLIQTGDVARADAVIETYTALYNENGLAQSRLWPAGTMCITIAANIADSAILGFDACFPDSIVGFIPFLNEIDVRFYEFFLRTAKSHLEDFAPSTAQKNINLEILGKVLIPVPPIREIHRIVSKIDEVMRLLDQLKIEISKTGRLRQKIADVLIDKAVI